MPLFIHLLNCYWSNFLKPRLTRLIPSKPCNVLSCPQNNGGKNDDEDNDDGIKFTDHVTGTLSALHISFSNFKHTNEAITTIIINL